MIAQETEDWTTAARSCDLGIGLLADASEPPPIFGMLLCLRGECDVFNGDVTSAVARTEAGLAVVRRHAEARGTWAEGFGLWNVGNAKRAQGDVDTAIADLQRVRRAVFDRSRFLRRGDGRLQSFG